MTRPSSLVVPTPRHHIASPADWLLEPALPPLHETASIKLTFGIALDNVSLLEQALWSVSDPDSPSYGKYWSVKQLAATTGAKRRAQSVLDWLMSSTGRQVGDATAAGDFVVATLTPTEASSIFSVPLHRHRHLPTDAVRHALMHGHKPRLPLHLGDAVSFVSGLDLPQWRRPRHSASARTRPQPQAQRAAVPTANGTLSVDVVESRDRAFQVHVTVKWPEAWGATAPPIGQWEAIATPSRKLERYLPPVQLPSVVLPSQCAPSVLAGAERSSTCVVTLGPSLSLVNYVPTALQMRVVWSSATGGAATTPWARYGDFVYPTKSMTPLNVRRLYGIPNGYTAAQPDGNTTIAAADTDDEDDDDDDDDDDDASNLGLGVANFLGISVDGADADAFHSLMGVPPQPPVTFVGANNSSNLVDVEGSIDLQWAQAVAWGIPAVYYSTAGGGWGHEPFLDWVVGLSNASSPPLVHSLSYGENEDAYGAEYEDRVNVELLKLGLRGVTVLAASGDTGVQGGAQAGGAPPRCAPFAPLWPASSPYVTAVGGTQFSDRVTSACSFNNVFAYGTPAFMPFACPDDNIGEIASSCATGAMITSGGGFSQRWPRPPYQQSAVGGYLRDAALPPASYFNRNGRGYPDLAAVSQNVPVHFNGSLQMVGGTSSAAPIVAAVVALLNAERLRLRMPPLGMINPWLYKVAARHPDAFNDVRAGNNSGGNRLLPKYVECEHGFEARPGWDAVTGFGSPNFLAMLAHAVPITQASINRQVQPPAPRHAQAETVAMTEAAAAQAPREEPSPLLTSQLVVALCAACSAVSAAVAAATTLGIVWLLQGRQKHAGCGFDGLRVHLMVGGK